MTKKLNYAAFIGIDWADTEHAVCLLTPDRPPERQVIAQKAEGKKNKVREEADAKHREELAGAQMQLLGKNTELTEQIHTLTESMNNLTQEVHAATCRRS